MVRNSARKWIISFLAIVLAIMMLLSAAAYIIDPFLQFRVRDNSYMLGAIFAGSGLIKNYDYDTLIVGSSMMQNFDMDVFREQLKVRPLHVGLGAIRASELIRFIDLAYEYERAENYYICVDLWQFSNQKESRLPEHLFKNDFLSRLRYLLSYEVWFRYIPVDVCLMIMDKMGIELPYKFRYSMSIDKLDDWQLNYPPSSFGREAVISNYRSEMFGVSDVETMDLYERMVSNIDAFFMNLDFDKGKHVFFFPPYSSLYWCDARNKGYYDAYLQAKRYFFEKAVECGAEVYDFQCADFTTDLDNYKDTTHFRPEFNDWMVECFAGGECMVTPENYDVFQEKLTGNTISFQSENADIFG